MMITILGATGMEKHAVSVGRIAANSVVREREVELGATVKMSMFVTDDLLECLKKPTS